MPLVVRHRYGMACRVIDADSVLLPDKMNFGKAATGQYGVVHGDGLNPPSEVVSIPAPLALTGFGLVGLGGCGSPIGR